MASKNKNKAKKKKEKIIYVDDGRTIADMSAVDGKRSNSGKGNKERKFTPPRATFKEQLETYFGAVKLMFLPMLAVLGIIALAFLILYFLL